MFYQEHLNKINKELLPIKIINWIFGLMIIELPLNKLRIKLTYIYSTFWIIIYLIMIEKSCIIINTKNPFNAYFTSTIFINISFISNLFIIVIFKSLAYNITKVST